MLTMLANALETPSKEVIWPSSALLKEPLDTFLIYFMYLDAIKEQK